MGGGGSTQPKSSSPSVAKRNLASPPNSGADLGARRENRVAWRRDRQGPHSEAARGGSAAVATQTGREVPHRRDVVFNDC